jgi:regulator of RNase E activity RraA
MASDDPKRQSIRERYLAVPSAGASDILDRMGRYHQGLASVFRPVSGERLTGWVYTIKGEPAEYPLSDGDQLKLEACEGVGRGEVSVWTGGGEGVCYFGDMIAIGMVVNGSVGALVDGGLRDIRAMDEIGFSAFARYTSAVQSIGRWRVTGYQVPVFLPGATSRWVRTEPGAFLVADEDGAVVIPADVVEEVLEMAEELDAADAEIREALHSGLSLRETREKYGHL